MCGSYKCDTFNKSGGSVTLGRGLSPWCLIHFDEPTVLTQQRLKFSFWQRGDSISGITEEPGEVGNAQRTLWSMGQQRVHARRGWWKWPMFLIVLDVPRHRKQTHRRFIPIYWALLVICVSCYPTLITSGCKIMDYSENLGECRRQLLQGYGP